LKKGSKNTTCNTQILGRQSFNILIRTTQPQLDRHPKKKKEEPIWVEDGDFWENAEGERPD
jgi:hypothetical protein